MKTLDIKKLNRAVELLQKAQQLINEVEKSDDKFKYSSNCNFRSNRINAAVDIMESEAREFSK